MKSKKKPPRTPVQKRQASIDIFEETIVATVYEGRGKKQKVITPADAVEIFLAGGSGIGRTEWMDYGPGVVRCGLAANGDIVAHLVRRAGRVKIRMHFSGKKKDRFVSVRLPNLLAELVRRGGQWSQVRRVWAYAGRLKTSTQLLACPLPNCHADGSLCMGDVQPGPAAKGTAAAWFEEAFINSTFTDHILHGPLRTGRPYENIWIAITKTGGRVPLSILTKAGKYGKIIHDQD